MRTRAAQRVTSLDQPACLLQLEGRQSCPVVSGSAALACLKAFSPCAPEKLSFQELGALPHQPHSQPTYLILALQLYVAWAFPLFCTPAAPLPRAPPQQPHSLPAPI